MSGDQFQSQLVIWTARVAAVVYLEASRRWLQSPRVVTRGYRWWWSAAWGLLVLHLLAAFQFEHAWSHRAAVEHSAMVTGRVTGWFWGGGVWFNYAFVAVWAADVAAMWGRPGWRTPAMLQGFAFFMVFNATVVFGSLWWLIPLLLWAGLAWHDRRRGRTPS